MVATAIAAVSTACVDAEIDLVVHDDGSGSMSLTINYDGALLEQATLGENIDVERLCAEVGEEAGAEPLDVGISALSWTAEAFIDGGDCVVTQTSSWDAADAEAVLAEMSEGDGFGLRRLDNDGWRFSLSGDELEETMGATDGELASLPDWGYEAPTLTISVKLPGDAVEHNADSARRSTYTWELDYGEADSLPETLFVETAPGSGLGPAAIGAIVAGALLALAALVTLRRRQQSKATSNEAAASQTSEHAAAPSQQTAAEPALQEGRDEDQADDGHHLDEDVHRGP